MGSSRRGASVVGTVVGLLLLFLASCGAPDTRRDDFANATVKALSVLTDEIVESVRKAPDERAGVAAAQQALDAEKGDLQPKVKELMALRSDELGDETRGNVARILVELPAKMAQLEIDLRAATTRDAALAVAVEKLTTDHQALVRGM